MNDFLLPGEMESIRRDVASLVNGSAGVDVVLHWTAETAADVESADVYGERATQVSRQETVRCHVSILTDSDVKRLGPVDAQEGDAYLIFGPDVDLKTDSQGDERKGLWFEIDGLGSFIQEEKQSLAAHAHAILFTGKLMPGREVFARAKR